MKKFFFLLVLLAGVSTLPLLAQENPEIPAEDTISMEQLQMLFMLDSIDQTMNYEKGDIQLGDGIAKLQVPPGYKYLNPEQSTYVLTDLWGNPPEPTLGLLFPDSSTIYTSDSYVIEITYDQIGYVEDEDAKDIDYDDLMKDMINDTNDANDYRIENGYESIQLVGWASPPYYDDQEKKLHWAKELKFGNSEYNTLNYNIRVLGRKGVLQLNFISDMDKLSLVESDLPAILPSVNFNQGYSYREFDPKIDEIAAVGIGGLIAGKVLAKAGFFGVLAKFGKFIIAGIIGLFIFLRKFFTGSKA